MSSEACVCVLIKPEWLHGRLCVRVCVLAGFSAQDEFVFHKACVCICACSSARCRLFQGQHWLMLVFVPLKNKENLKLQQRAAVEGEQFEGLTLSIDTND